MKINKWIIGLIILLLLIFRIFLGIQINFSHEDYQQIYLMGLENAFSNQWSYWGPDVVWSKTRLPGALQGLLGGIPIRLTGHPYAPIIFSNIISAAGLLLMSFYTKKRFPQFSLYFLIPFFLLLPFYLFHGVVMLNTAYLIFSGALLFIPVFELFIYRDQMVLKNPAYYFLAIGFSLLFTYQLHLTWVMYIPFIIVLFYLEWKRNSSLWWKPLLYFSIGGIIAGATLFPTLFTYFGAIFNNVDGNLAFKPERLGSIFDLLIRYFTFATFDVTASYSVFDLAAEKSIVNLVLLKTLQILAIIQFIGVCITFVFIKKTLAFRKIMLLFVLTLLMALALYTLSNKHLSARTYILLFPIPIWMSFHAYNYLLKYKLFQPILNISLVLVFFAFLGVALANYNDQYSFKAVEKELNEAFEQKAPYLFHQRRKTLMDEFQ